MSDNLMTKAQALLNLYNADIPRSFANAIVGLFGDPNAVTKAQEEMFGPQISQLGAGKETDLENQEDNENVDNKDTEDNEDKKNANIKIQEEQNIVKKVTEQDEQEQ